MIITKYSLDEFIKGLLFFDLEWVPAYESFDMLKLSNPVHAESWISACKRWQEQGKVPKDKSIEDIYWDDAGFYPEFSKIVCASFGFVNPGGEWQIQSWVGDDESFLNEISELLTKTSGKYKLCGKSIKEYDMPWLAKRMAINDVKVPPVLLNWDKKPWDLTMIDIGEMWSYGSFREKFTPLAWIATSLGIPTPKDDISGADVKNVYWKDKDLDRIRVYCEKDVEVLKKILETGFFCY